MSFLILSLLLDFFDSSLLLVIDLFELLLLVRLPAPLFYWLVGLWRRDLDLGLCFGNGISSVDEAISSPSPSDVTPLG